MKKILTLLLLAGTTTPGFAQTTDQTTALDLIKKNASLLGLSGNDIDNSSVSSSYIVTGSSLRMVYLQQTFKGLPVYNKLHVLAFKDGVPASIAGERVANIEKVAEPQTAAPLTTAPMAVLTALKESNIIFNQNIQPLSSTNNGRHVEFGDLGVSRDGISANLLWVPDNNGKVQLAWQVEVSPKGTSDGWQIRVNTNTNTVLDKNNLTIYCNWDKKERDQFCNDINYTVHEKILPIKATASPLSTFLVNDATYNVIPFPAESPIHPGGTPANHINPWLMAPAGSNATTLKWHSNGTTDYNTTRGNNVFAYEDADANNTGGVTDTSTSIESLTFPKVYDFALAPNAGTNQRSAIVNLFYWNNIIHDVAYLYGFDEVSGNFQTNNQGRGGAGNDAVLAEAQDGSGLNNANFNNSGVDGGTARMQMYIWDAPTPDRDGDLDNGIILHEYTHGISTRMTGGPAAGGCLSNNEQMGEGWSDYFGLMLTTNWATASPADGFNISRGIGTYALNQPITGVGIRQYPYTTNMAVNPFTYSNITTVAIPHGIGSVWCTMLWDMTWNMIQIDGINPSTYNSTGTGGNIAALKLVTEGLRLQPCSPGFVDGRNAILKADSLFFGGRYSCAIWEAFARRGVGVRASQGLSTSRTDQTVNFEIPVSNLNLAANMAQQVENQNIIYTETTRALCGAISNFKMVDTLPANVTHVSGGTYNAGNRTVTFSGINLAIGASRSDNFTVKINAGAYFAPITHINETVTTATIPAAWTTTSTTASVWTVSAAQSVSAPNSFFAPDAAVASEQILATTAGIAVNDLTIFTFQHSYNTESGWDGGVLEISINDGVTWTDLTSFVTSGGYNGTLGSGSALAGRKAYTGNSGGFVTTTVDLTSFRGKTIKIRFRFASDTNTGGTGWYVDNIKLTSEATVMMKSNLFNSSDVLQGSKELSTKISAPTLPLSLISFGGYLDNNDAKLQWITENESGVRMFEVQRSSDGVSFTTIAQVNGLNRSGRSQYNTADANIAVLNTSNIIYYRLKMIDIDGSFSYSRIIKINLGKAGAVTIAPNPVKDQLILTGFNDNQRYEAVVTDVTGKIVISTKVSAIDNTINTSMLATGMYVLKISSSDSGFHVYRLVKN